MPNDQLWNNLGDNYNFEFDMKFVAGTDHNVAFRFEPPNPNYHNYELHFQSPGDFFMFDGVSHDTIKVPGSYSNGNTYHIKISVNGRNIKVYINNLLVRDSTTSVGAGFLTGRIALRAGTGGDPISETYFDNIVVTSIEPSNDITLNVPPLKQTSNPWQSLTYDSANIWSPSAFTINRWGCALTSAVMVFRYQGLTKMPDGLDLNPGTVNSWLKEQKDGYIGDGLVNWLALSRLSRLAKNSGNNPVAQLDALEYKRFGSDTSQLTSDLQNNIPDILQEPGHFIVANGTTDISYSIKDPFYNRSLLSDNYNNAFSSLGQYKPSHTDLSYVLLATSPDFNITLHNNDGDWGDSFIEGPIVDPVDKKAQSGSLRELYYPQFQNGTYTVHVDGDAEIADTPHAYTLLSYIYDKDGNVSQHRLSGVARPNEGSIITLQADNQDTTQDTVVKVATIDTIRADIQTGVKEKQISKGARIALQVLVALVQKEISSGHILQSKILLKSMLPLIKASSGKGISTMYAAILTDDITGLLATY